jgi:hypothetical protein
MIVIVEEKVRKISSAMVAGLIGTSVGPFPRDGLNEAFRFAVGLRSVRFGEEMFEAELIAGCGEVFGAIGGAAIGEDALDSDAMRFVEVDGLAESVEDMGDFFIRQEAGEGEAAMIIHGDVEALDAGARVAHGAIAGGPDAGACEAAQFLDVEVKELAGMSALVAQNRRLWRFESGEAMQAVAAQDARDGGFGDVKPREDLGVGAALASQGQDVGFEPGAGLAWLKQRDRGTVLELRGKAVFLGALEPSPDGSFTDMVGDGDGAPREVMRGEMNDHFGSHQRSESGISVHVVRAGWKGVEY